MRPTTRGPAPAARVPAFCAPWECDLLSAVDLRAGDRVLDVSRATRDPSSLPFGDGSFDVVVCRQGLQLLPDRGRALAEMWRVLVPSGRVAVASSGRIERSPAFAALANSLERHAGVRVAAAVRWLFSLSEADDLRALLAGAGFDGIRVQTADKTTRFPSVAEFLRRYLPRSMIGSTGTHPSDGERRVAADLEAELAPWVDADGLRIATEVNTGVATR